LRKSWFVVSLALVVVSLLSLNEALAEPPARPLGQEALAKLDSPLTNSFVQGNVQVKGSAAHPQFDFYKVEFGPGESPSDDQMAIVGAIHEQQVTGGLLETWDTTVIPDGTYTLRLRVVDVTGNYQEDWVRRLSVNNTSPTPTTTPEATPAPVFLAATSTPTNIAPTPTIVVEQPFLNQPTATPPPPPTVESSPAPTSGAMVVGAAPTSTPVPQPTSTPGPNINDLFQPEEWGNAFFIGALLMAGIFTVFGVLSLLRRAVLLLLSSR
jgi:hypothetical protein